MTDNVQSAMFEILKRIQSDIAALSRDMSEMKTSQLDMAAKIFKLTRDQTGMLVIMRSTVSEFEARVTELEREMELVKDHVGFAKD